MRRTVVFGKIIENVYKAVLNQKKIYENGEEKTVYIDKPKIVKTPVVMYLDVICDFEGEPRFNDNGLWKSNEFNISEDEVVTVESEIFRADLNEVHLFTNKVMNENDTNKDESIALVEKHIKLFNKMMIESNDKLKAYCDLHKLTYEDTNCVELFKLVFPDNEYEIVDGVMKEKYKYTNISTIETGVVSMFKPTRTIINNSKMDCSIDAKVATIHDEIETLSSAISCCADCI